MHQPLSLPWIPAFAGMAPWVILATVPAQSPSPSENAIRYAFTFVALILALIIGIIGVVVYFANAPKAPPVPAPAASSSVAN